VTIEVPASSRSLLRTFRDGAVVNLLNPKVALFFVAFLPQFVDREDPGSVTGQLLVLGATFFALALALDLVYATLSGAAARFVRRAGGRIGWLRWPVAAVYVALATYAVAS
jgi:threonine/homoserine/homoserine lactone efflux protein